MMTRSATLYDLAKLAEMGGTDFIAAWTTNYYGKENGVSLITIDHKQIIACLLGYIEEDIFETIVFFMPEGKPEIGKYLFDKVESQFKDKGLKYINFLAEPSKDWETLGLKPIQTLYIKELENINGTS